MAVVYRLSANRKSFLPTAYSRQPTAKMPNPFDLTGKTALITGASRGLGQQFARALASAGADLAITSRTRASLDPFAAEMKSLGRRVACVELNLREQSSIETAVADALGQLGQIDILVNNAGCNIRKPAVDVTWEDWNTILDTNLRGTFFVAQAVAKHMTAPHRPHHQHRLGDVRRRLRRPWPLWCKPRRRQAAHDEPRP